MAFTAILRGYPTGYQAQGSTILDTIADRNFPDRASARAEAQRRWGSRWSERRAENSVIRIVDTDEPEWAYLSAPVCVV